MEVVIPYSPRPLQREIHDNFKRWNLLVSHRRFGKTVLAVNQLIKDALLKVNNPRLAYIAPLRNQAKAIAWDYLKFYSRPIPLIKIYENELRVDYPNGARVQLFGCDNPDALRGIYLDGVVLDEYAQMPSYLFGEVIRPALTDRQGYALFMGTPKGKNAFFDLYQDVKDNPDWLVRIYRASQTQLIPQAELDDARKVMDSDQFAQEYECSWSAAIHGAYYAKLLQDAEAEKRITILPVDPALKVHTAWDLGVRDATAIWFAQVRGPEFRLVDYYENSGVGLEHYAKVLQDKRYLYGEHYAPPDIKVVELGSGKSRLEIGAALGIKFTVAESTSLADGIQAVRSMLPMSWIDKDRCKRGLECLANYRQEWDDRRQAFRGNPLHDWSSHAADALRYFAISYRRAAAPFKPINYPKVKWV